MFTGINLLQRKPYAYCDKWNDECLNILETITDEIRKLSEGKRPLPLKNSNKCIRCSLNTVCLPDETAIMTSSDLKGSARAVVPARYDHSLVYVSGYDKKISLNGECLVISSFSGERQEIPIKDVLSVSIMGTAQISTQCIQSLMENGVKVMFCSSGGWLYGVAGGFTDKNLMVRKKQVSLFPDLELAKQSVSTKIFHQRLLLRRKRDMVEDGVLDNLLSLSNQALSVQDRDTLLGIEGIAAKINFDNLPRLLNDSGMEFNGRSRRPPRDPVNAMLSYAYSLLAKDFVNAIIAVGLEPSVGYYHVFEKGRPALALDLMESYRPLIADSSVIRVINTKMLTIDDFEVTMAGVSMKLKAKKQFIMAYEQRMNTMVMHPMFDYQMSYRRMLEV